MSFSYYRNLGRERVFERRVDDDVKDFVDGELAAIQGQLKSLDEEFFQVRKHRDGLMNHARYLMAEKKQSRSTATRKNGKVQAENGSSHQLGVGNENVEESEDEVRKQSRAEMGRELMEHAKQIQQAARAKAEEERSKREQERRKAEEEKRRQEEIKRKKAEEEKRRQAEIERQNAEKERKRQELELELELELQQIKEKRNRVYAEETKQKQESELRRRQLEELRRQEEEEQRKAEELQRVRQAELEKEEEIRKKLARMRSGGEEAVKDESFMREARGKSVDLAALRPYKSYVLKFRDDSMKTHNLPYGLDKLIDRVRNSDLPTIDYLSLGPEGQFFVRLLWPEQEG